MDSTPTMDRPSPWDHAGFDHRPAAAASSEPRATPTSDVTGRAAPPTPGDRSATLDAILEELRTLRREQRHEDFSIGRLAAAVAQAFALCAIGWALFIWFDATAEQMAVAATRATVGLLAGIALQLLALTCFTASRR